MWDSPFVAANTLSRALLAEVRGGEPTQPTQPTAPAPPRATNVPPGVKLPPGTLGVRPEDCGPAGPDWTVKAKGSRRMQFLGIDIPFTNVPFDFEATQCK